LSWDKAGSKAFAQHAAANIKKSDENWEKINK
jgi:hypothetical protein